MFYYLISKNMNFSRKSIGKRNFQNDIRPERIVWCERDMLSAVTIKIPGGIVSSWMSPDSYVCMFSNHVLIKPWYSWFVLHLPHMSTFTSSSRVFYSSRPEVGLGAFRRRQINPIIFLLEVQFLAHILTQCGNHLWLALYFPRHYSCSVTPLGKL